MAATESTNEPTIVGAVLRHPVIFSSVVLACVVLGAVFALIQPTEWSATASLVVEDPRASSLFGEQAALGRDADRYVENQAAVIRSDTVAQEVIDSPELAVASDWTLNEFSNRLTVATTQGSDVITIGFVAAEPDLALESVNAVTGAYRSLLRSEANRTFAAAIDEVSTSIERWNSDLETIQADIAALTESDETRSRLDSQYEEALARLSDLQAQLLNADAERATQIRVELDDLARFFEVTERLDSIQRQSPELAALLEQQSEAVRQLSELAVLRDQLSVDAELAGSGVVVVSPAEEVEPVGASLPRTGAVSLVIGVLLGAAAVFTMAQRNQAFGGRLQPEPILASSLLAEVPSFAETGLTTSLPVREASASATAEAYRFLTTALEMKTRAEDVATTDVRRNGTGVRTFAVVSANAGDGKTVTTANIALAAARDGYRVLAIDADFDDQALTRLLVDEEASIHGLPDLVSDRITLPHALAEVAFDHDRVVGHRTMPGALDLLGRGRTTVAPADFFSMGATREILAGIMRQYDFVVIDTPPLLHRAYASAVIGMAHQAVVVIPHGSKPATAEELADRLRLIGTATAGYVYNKAPLRREVTGSRGSGGETEKASNRARAILGV